MKLTQVPNFRVEDFPSEQSWIGRMFIQLNPLVQSLNQILDQNIDYLTNLKSITKTYDISTFQAFSFTWPYPNFIPNELTVTKALKGNSNTPTILLAAWNYDSTNSLITVSRMVELLTGSVAELSGRYQFSIRATI